MVATGESILDFDMIREVNHLTIPTGKGEEAPKTVCAPGERDGLRSRFCGLRDVSAAVDTRITTSRFGRLFRLSGTGHVSFLPICHLFHEWSHMLTTTPRSNTKEIQGATVLRELRTGLITFCHDGIYYCRQCAYALVSPSPGRFSHGH
jgi:hypothetical protein